MKNHRKEKSSKEGHTVETPAPPQVMDPSAPPVQQSRKDEKKQKPKNKADKNQDVAREKLTPREEL